MKGRKDDSRDPKDSTSKRQLQDLTFYETNYGYGKMRHIQTSYYEDKREKGAKGNKENMNSMRLRPFKARKGNKLIRQTVVRITSP